jgi:uncharacterized repeat protein (TIGR04042 family)
MPALHFRIEWPDGREASCYSPSTVIREYLTPGTRYALDDFVATARSALGAASERVRAKYGFACSSALDQLAQIEQEAERFREWPAASVTMIDFN